MNERVLLLEDDKYIQDLIGMKFKLERIEVEIAKSVDEALELIKSRPWDCTIIDIMFPTRSGVDIAEHIIDNGLDVPFIFISAKNRAVFLEEFRDSVEKYPVLSTAEYIMKPFDLDFLIQRIRESIARTKAEKELEQKKKDKKKQQEG